MWQQACYKRVFERRNATIPKWSIQSRFGQRFVCASVCEVEAGMRQRCIGSIRWLKIHFLVAAAALMCSASQADDETFTISLVPSAEAGLHGSYLSAPFDFGTAFSEIESLTLRFAMPGGYEGSAVSTGNSFYWRSLNVVLHPADTPAPEYWQNSPSSLGALTLDVRPNAETEFRFLYSVSFGNDPAPPSWPEFLYTGIGRVGWTDEFFSGLHPLPDGVPTSSSTSWALPGEIQSAELIIVGTPVPEPASLLLVAASIAVSLSHRRLSRAESRSFAVLRR
jgi:hypothetical protein